jgi:hypothetical protein
VLGPVVAQREYGAANFTAAAAMAPPAVATTAPHLVPPVSVAASLSVHLCCSFRSITS